jgi:hypothetical protein
MTSSYEYDFNFVMGKLSDHLYRVDVMLDSFSSLQSSDISEAKKVRAVLAEEINELQELLIYRGHMSNRSAPPMISRIFFIEPSVYSGLYKLRDEAKKVVGVQGEKTSEAASG